jgi:hypothetical protein
MNSLSSHVRAAAVAAAALATLSTVWLISDYAHPHVAVARVATPHAR